jgi:urease accessory protein
LSEVASLLVAARYADSAYPSGGFAHSWGLETACALGHIAGAPSLARAVAAIVHHQTAPADGVAAAACSRAAAAEDMAAFRAVDRRLSATRAARETREASARMGRRLAETAARAEGDGWLRALWELVQAGDTPGNHAAVLGAVAGRRGLDPAGAAALALWTAVNGSLAAAQRLIPITHDEVQSILSELLPVCAELASWASEQDPGQMAGSMPLAEIWSMQHEMARVRLFGS